ncbi:MAG: glycosyltransferase family 39 protein [Elusimicrobia bacterium]|nr:glycosyltransferase family 39 protein [Elusimicrobiota bacterium]
MDWEGPSRQRAATELPLYMWLVGLLWPLAGLAELWGRWLAAAASALTAVYVLLLAEEDFGREAGLYAGLLFSFIPLEIFFGRTVQPEAFALCATVAGLYHWRRGLAPERPWLHWAAGSLAVFIAVGHKLPYAYVFLPLAWLVWEARGREAWKDLRSWAGLAAAAGGVLAWYRYAASGTYVVPTHVSSILGILDYGKLGYYVKFQFLSRFPELSATHIGLLFLGAGAYVARRHPRRGFYAAWFLSVAGSLAAYGGYSFFHEYTSLPFAPVNAALMGAGLVWLRGRAAALSRGRRPALAVLLVLTVGMPVYSVLRIRHWYRVNYPFLTSAERAADAVGRRGDLFLVNERAPSVFLFHLHRKGWHAPFMDRGPEALDCVEPRIREGARFFATAKSGYFAGRDGAVARYFYSRFPVAWDADGLLIFRLQ